MQMDVTSVGNHEFDEGVTELLRLQNGGCHPTDGCQDGDPFAGADFPYLAANVVYKVTGKPILPPYTDPQGAGRHGGLHRDDARGHARASSTRPASRRSTSSTRPRPPTTTSTCSHAQGVHAIVILLHEGGQQSPPPSPLDPSGCANFTGALPGIVADLDPDIDLVVSGHTHRSYVCHLPNSAGAPVLATSAATAGVLVTDITATLSRSRDDFTSLSAQNVIVQNGVQNPDGSWQKDAAGNFVRNPALVDPLMKTLLDKYRTAIAPIANRIVGSITADITRTDNAAGESALGDVIADAQLAYTTSSAGAQIALMNPGGIRSDLIYAFSPGGEAPGQVTYGEAFTVQPFNNLVTTQTFTGAQIKAVLEQQFRTAPAANIFLQVSRGFTYSYNSTMPPENRISNMPAQRRADRPGRDLPGDDQRLPRQRGRRLHPADGRHQPGLRARLRRRRAGRLPRHRLDRAGPAEPLHQDRLTRSSQDRSLTTAPSREATVRIVTST